VEVESQGQMERVLGAQKSQELLTVLKLLDWDSNMVNLNRCEFGLSNDNYQVSTTGKDPLFLKVFGPLTGNINLDELHLQKCNFGPEVIKKFDWGRLEVWVTGRPMARPDCENFDVLSAFAAELAFMHKTTQRNHNDLNFTNILIGANEKIEIHFLDFEYVGKLDPAYDIANFFCEWMYDCGSPLWFEPDVSKFPSQDQMRFFVEQYLQAFNPNEVGLNSLLKDVENRIPKVHNYWINWAKNGFPGQVDYEKYALNRQKLLNVDLL
jgi:hypothetical protein